MHATRRSCSPVGRDHCAERVGRRADGDLQDAAANPEQGLGVCGHPATLNQLELIADHFLCAGGKRLQVAFGTPHPHQRRNTGVSMRTTRMTKI